MGHLFAALWHGQPSIVYCNIWAFSWSSVVTEPSPYDRGLIAISSYGIAGTNAHGVFEPGHIASEAPAAS